MKSAMLLFSYVNVHQKQNLFFKSRSMYIFITINNVDGSRRRMFYTKKRFNVSFFLWILQHRFILAIDIQINFHAFFCPQLLLPTSFCSHQYLKSYSEVVKVQLGNVQLKHLFYRHIYKLPVHKCGVNGSRIGQVDSIRYSISYFDDNSFARAIVKHVFRCLLNFKWNYLPFQNTLHMLALCCQNFVKMWEVFEQSDNRHLFSLCS